MKNFLLYLIVFGLSIGTASAQPVAEEFYSLNETSGQAIDKQGHNNSKEVQATQGVAGKIGTCYLFNGTTDKVTFADSDNWTLKKTDNFSLSAWINFTADIKASWGTIWGNAADIGVGVKKISAGNYGIFWYAGSSVPTSTTFTMTPGEWYHIVVVKTSSTSVNFYLNNVLLKTAAPGDKDVNPSAVYIGGNEMNNEYFNGKIDEVGIWKTVLTASDVAALYNAVPTRLSEVAGSNKISFYPQPVTDFLNISQIPNHAQISVYNITGKEVLHQLSKNQDNIKISMDGLVSGVYLVKVTKDNAVIKSFKVTKN